MRKQRRRSAFAVTAKLISAFVFATQIVQSLYYLNPKFQASSHLLWLYRPVCVGPGRKPRRPVFSKRGSYKVASKLNCSLLLQVGCGDSVVECQVPERLRERFKVLTPGH